jgi:putative ABC transport system ATP-binding protein
VLELERVVKHYHGEQVRAVDGVSLQVRAGEMVALQGPSGSGKTTLLLLVARLADPDAGRIRYEGSDISLFSETQASEFLLREVGFIYQGAPLMARVSSLENAAVKLMLAGTSTREAQRRAQPWLERLGLGGRLEHTPEELSAGERQRVTIAGVLAAQPRLILADEPTGSLDSRSSTEVAELLREVARERGGGVLLVTHDTEAAAAADRRLLLRDGRLS